MKPPRRRAVWALWIISTLLATGLMALLLFGDINRRIFLPGVTSHGHHQIELACTACHTKPFGGGGVIQEACTNCHGEELKLAKDAHPMSKFTDPRNADRISELDATLCTTCHVEHRPEITHKMLLTRPVDYCISCHRDIAKERPSHQGMEFNTCADAGCHNFHDNRALYEDFLLKHVGETWLRQDARLPSRELLAWFITTSGKTPAPLSVGMADTPRQVKAGDGLLHDWAGTAHAAAGVNCSDCHQAKTPEAVSTWVDKPGHMACEGCHGMETRGFLAGKHGMRIAQKLSPMQPAMARIPMHQNAAHRELGCTSCHAAHQFDTQFAAVEACLGCHADEHSRAFKLSPHGQLWAKTQNGELPDGASVSCASCHMPRFQWDDGMGSTRTAVEHNQNDTLRPNEKMIRPVCLTCHGMEFAIDALADPVLVQSNFKGRPARHVESMDMVLRRLEVDRQRRERDQNDTGE